MKTIIFLFFLLTSTLALANFGEMSCIENTVGSGACTPIIDGTTGRVVACKLKPGGVCNITAGSNDACIQTTNLRSEWVLAPAGTDASFKDWDFFAAQPENLFLVRKDPSPGACGTRATVHCDIASGITWDVGGTTCSGSLPGGNATDTQAITDSTGPALGNATFICSGGFWTVQPGAVCYNNCNPTTLTWGSCSATVGTTSNNATQNLTDPDSGGGDGWQGTASFVCTNGTYNVTSQSCTGIACDPLAVNWNGACNGSLPATASGSNQTISTTSVGYAGSATYTCANRNWSGPYGNSCSLSCPSGTSPSGAGGATPNPGCNCNNPGDIFCNTTLTCTVTCPAGSSEVGSGGVVYGTCRCNNGGENWNGGGCYRDCGGFSPSWSSCSGSYGSAASHGASVTVNNSAANRSGSANYTCNNGNWDGPTSQSCNVTAVCGAGTDGTPDGGASCTGPGGYTIQSGCSKPYYANSSADNCGGACTSCVADIEYRLCSNGVLDGYATWAICNDFCGQCFLAGTQVTMEDGSTKNIEDVLKGDRIRTYDEKTKNFTVSPVVQTLHHEAKAQVLYEFMFENGVKLTSNDIHPFYVIELGMYMSAKDIYKRIAFNQSLHLLGEDGFNLEIVSVHVYEEVIKTYNLHVRGVYDTNEKEAKDGHNYFANGVLVHNLKETTFQCY